MAIGFDQNVLGNTDGGIANPLEDKPPIVNFNFVLRVEALWDIACKSIKIERKENEFDLIQEGGLNDYPHRIRKQITRMFTLRIEQYVGAGFVDPLSLGTKLVLPLMLSVGRYTNPAIFLPDRQYIFTGCEVTAKEPGELQSERSGLLTESTTIAYESMFTIDTPFEGIKESWAFDQFNKDGNGKGSRDKRFADYELTQAEMAARTQRWSMVEASKAQGISDVRTEPSVSSRQNLFLDSLADSMVDMSKEDMAKRAKVWTFDEKDAYKIETTKNYQGRGTASRQNVNTNSLYNSYDTHMDEMAGKAALWKFDEKDQNNTGLQMINHEGAGAKSRQSFMDETKIEKNKSRNDSIAAANRWDFNPDDKNNKTPKKDQKGVGVHSSQNLKTFGEDEYGYDTPTDTMLENAQKWQFDEKDENNKGLQTINHQGKGDVSRQNRKMPAETPRGTMINEAAKHEWKFDEKDQQNTGLQYINKKGNEKTSSQKFGEEEVSRDNLAKKTARWNFDPSDVNNTSPNKNKEGSGNASRQNKRGDYAGITELSQDMMKEKASHWPPKQSAQNIADFLSGGNK